MSLHQRGLDALSRTTVLGLNADGIPYWDNRSSFIFGDVVRYNIAGSGNGGIFLLPKIYLAI